ncbi:hypothetical protein GHT06_003250 [Daphnia sinensis]|uniref:Uncharacterized protein n=1 Tax=Daphnia sinensis TaxID=1820382 RepID=A0AAD5KWM4_9CRUS|nr:hypothetical protein GHT06_001909 [Daphnia sinensis]KAI9551318.1 hypothetical protein GHT06_003250 [Daphnia sinensis]
MLFRRNRQAINVNKAALRQVSKAPYTKSRNSDCSRPFTSSRVTRASRVFVDDRISGVAAPPAPRPVTLNPPVEQPEVVTNADTFEDFMEAFHGFELVFHRQRPCRVRPPPPTPRRSQSAETREFSNPRKIRPGRIRCVPGCTNDTLRTPINGINR